MKKSMLYFILALCAGAIMLVVGSYAFSKFKRQYADVVADEAKATIGSHTLVTVSDAVITAEYQVKRDTLYKDLQYYDELYSLRENLRLGDYPFDTYNSVNAAMSQLFTMDKTAKEVHGWLMSRSWETGWNHVPTITEIQTKYNKLNKETHKPLHCVLAETETLIAKYNRGEYREPYCAAYNVNIEVPINANISYFGHVELYLYKNTKKPDLHKIFIGQLANALKYKAENTCN